jgi:hypothetical protein
VRLDRVAREAAGEEERGGEGEKGEEGCGSGGRDDDGGLGGASSAAADARGGACGGGDVGVDGAGRRRRWRRGQQCRPTVVGVGAEARRRGPLNGEERLVKHPAGVVVGDRSGGVEERGESEDQCCQGERHCLESVSCASDELHSKFRGGRKTWKSGSKHARIE